VLSILATKSYVLVVTPDLFYARQSIFMSFLSEFQINYSPSVIFHITSILDVRLLYSHWTLTFTLGHIKEKSYLRSNTCS